ncbi:mce associated protein mas1a [Mycobacterium sp. LTG2003]
MNNPDDDDVRSDAVLTLERPVPEDEVLEGDPVSETPDDEDAPRRRIPRRLIAAVVGLVAVAGVATLVVLSVGEYHHRQTEALRAAAVATSHDYLVAMAGFDYQKLDANREYIVANSTPEFASKYDEMVKALRDIVVTSKGVATATADHVVVDRLDGDTATVVAFVDQHVTNVTAPQGSEQKYRMVVSLLRSGDRWIVNDVQTV